MATTLFNFGPELDAVLANTKTIIANQTKILATLATNEQETMAAIDDLNTAVASLTTEVGTVVTTMNTLLADLTAALAAAGMNNDPAIETAVSNINAQVSALQAAVTADAPPSS
jgi:hypothetical protein